MRKRSSQEAGLSDAEDGEEDVTSPLKPIDTKGKDQGESLGARRNLDFNLSDTQGQDQPPKVPDAGMTSLGDKNQALAIVPPLPPQYVSPRESKKAKTTTSPKKQNTNKMASLAGSDSERR